MFRGFTIHQESFSWIRLESTTGINVPTQIEKCYISRLFVPFESAHLF